MKYVKITPLFSFALLGLLMVSLLSSCNSQQTTESTENSQISEAPVPSLAEEFEASIAGDKLTMVDFYAEWCGPCKRMAPFITEVKNEHSDKVNVMQIDAEKYMDISQNYNLEGYPTIIFFKNGKIVDRVLGYMDKQQILEYVNRLK